MSRRLLSLFSLCGLLVLLAGCGHRPILPSTPQPEVSIARPITQDITNYEDFTGRIDSPIYVDIRARVNGYLTKVYFADTNKDKQDRKEGLKVREGDDLYLIDPRPYQADLDKAKGMVAKYEGTKVLYTTQVDRYTKLVAKGAASQQELDTYKGNLAETIGSLEAAKAQVEYATLNLNFCTIKAPITGEISRTYVQVGDLVETDKTLLTTLVSTDPMYAYFNVEEPVYLRVKQMLIEHKIARPQQIKAALGLADDVDRKFPLHGELDFFNNQIDPLTGTITVRAVVPNPDGLLKPGLFCRVRVPLSPKHKGVLVAESAIGTDQGQKFVYIVGDDNKVREQRVRTGQLFGGFRAIDEGLKGDEWVVVKGLQRVRQDVVVKAERVSMNSVAGPIDAADTKK